MWEIANWLHFLVFFFVFYKSANVGLFSLKIQESGNLKGLFGDFAGAIKDFDRAIELNPRSQSSLLARALAKMKMREYDGCAKDLELAEKISASTEVYIGRGSLKKALGDLDGAFKEFSKALQIDKSNVVAFQNRGGIELERGNARLALDDLNVAERLDPGNPITLQQRGVAKRLCGDLSGSLKDLNSALTSFPGNVVALQQRGITKHMLYHFDALDDFNEADQLQPRSPLTIGHRAICKYKMYSIEIIEKHQLPSIDQDLEYAHSLLPNDPDIIYYLACVKNNLNQNEKAIELLNQGLDLRPNDAVFIYKRGLVYRDLSNLEKYQTDIKRAIQMEPTQPTTLQLRGILRRENGDLEGSLKDLTKAFEGRKDWFSLFQTAVTRKYQVRSGRWKICCRV